MTSPKRVLHAQKNIYILIIRQLKTQQRLQWARNDLLYDLRDMSKDNERGARRAFQSASVIPIWLLWLKLNRCYVLWSRFIYFFFQFFLFSILIFLGGIGLLWSVLWFLIIFETPAVHPRISREELEEIESAIGSSMTRKKPTYVPWFDIFTAPCVWAIVITHGTSVFGYFTIVNQLPTYMKEILHFDIKQVRIEKQTYYYYVVFIAAVGSTTCISQFIIIVSTYQFLFCLPANHT